jgi:hypothetical protein
MGQAQTATKESVWSMTAKINRKQWTAISLQPPEETGWTEGLFRISVSTKH